MKTNDILQEILLSREARERKQIELLKKYKCTLISFTLNIPGPIKDTPIYRKIHYEGMKAVKTMLIDKKAEILYVESRNKKTGSEGYICTSISGEKLKEYTIKIEESHKLGRIFDIDIIDEKNNIVSRKDMNLPPRKCFLCNDKALVCRRIRKHTIEELVQGIHDLYYK